MDGECGGARCMAWQGGGGARHLARHLGLGGAPAPPTAVLRVCAASAPFCRSPTTIDDRPTHAESLPAAARTSSAALHRHEHGWHRGCCGAGSPPAAMEPPTLHPPRPLAAPRRCCCPPGAGAAAGEISLCLRSVGRSVWLGRASARARCACRCGPDALALAPPPPPPPRSPPPSALTPLPPPLGAQNQKSFQKQDNIFVGKKRVLGKKLSGKDIRYCKPVGLGIKTPRSAVEGTYVDKKCPWTGALSSSLPPPMHAGLSRVAPGVAGRRRARARLPSVADSSQ